MLRTLFFLSSPCSVLRVFWLSTFALLSTAWAVAQEESQVPLPREAEVQEGIPAGKVEGPFMLASKIYPGTEREYWLYIPAQYDPQKPACVMIVQDGMQRALGWHLPTVCDNLIHAQEMPVTIGIFVSPGEVPATQPNAQPRYNRSFEYDALGDRYARFLLEELLPEVSKKYSLSTDPNDRSLAGASSGGICAFNAAWERPDAFRRVISTIGTFVGLRGGDQFPTLVRKVEPKPLRIFLQDGSNDLNIYAGDWWLANQSMLSALQWAGYDVRHAWDDGGHSVLHSAAIMPDALRWLWRDYPQPIVAASQNAVPRRTDVLLPAAGWQEVSSGHEQAEALSCSASGELFFSDAKAGRIYRVGEDSKTRIFVEQSGRISSLAFGADGKLYACKDAKQIVRFDPEGKEQVVLADVKCQMLTTMPQGFYFVDPTTPAVWWSSYEGVAVQALPLTEAVSAMAPTPDHAFMHMVATNQQYTTHSRITGERLLDHRQQYGYLHLPYLERNSGANRVVVDTEGRTYIATSMGIQIMDPLGRVQLILSKPTAAAINGMAFGGTRRDTLFVTDGRSVYRRRLNAKGVRTFEAPLQTPKPQL
ncbi:MAG: gluconolactonase [Planctomycetales bacterium]|nr:gluconolactonase [Planctomycetales bacterium]